MKLLNISEAISIYWHLFRNDRRFDHSVYVINEFIAGKREMGRNMFKIYYATRLKENKRLQENIFSLRRADGWQGWRIITIVFLILAQGKGHQHTLSHVFPLVSTTFCLTLIQISSGVLLDRLRWRFQSSTFLIMLLCFLKV